jgi:VWFA-related protein
MQFTPPPQAPAVFRAGVDFVHIDVVVTGDSDKPIPDLTAADFELKENGKPQAISDFRFVNIPVAHRKIDLDQPTATPDVATNAPTSPNSRLFVMIIDDLHLVEPTLVPVQRIMTEFIDALSPDDEVAILFVGHSNLSQNFTNDRRSPAGLDHLAKEEPAARGHLRPTLRRPFHALASAQGRRPKGHAGKRDAEERERTKAHETPANGQEDAQRHLTRVRRPTRLHGSIGPRGPTVCPRR